MITLRFKGLVRLISLRLLTIPHLKSKTNAWVNHLKSSQVNKNIIIFLDKFYWVSDAKPPQNIPNAFFFNIDNDLTYSPFNSDFGPLNLANVHRYCRELQKLI